MKGSIPEARRPIHRQMFPRRSNEEENKEDEKIKKTELNQDQPLKAEHQNHQTNT